MSQNPLEADLEKIQAAREVEEFLDEVEMRVEMRKAREEER